jgi:hypothetical protein
MTALGESGHWIFWFPFLSGLGVSRFALVGRRVTGALERMPRHGCCSSGDFAPNPAIADSQRRLLANPAMEGFWVTDDPFLLYSLFVYFAIDFSFCHFCY